MTSTPTLTIRALARGDLDAVVAIDAAIEGRPRRAYVERRLSAALREPTMHAQFAACSDDRLDGYILARVLEGEFGRTEPGLRLEMVGVDAGARGHGVGKRLFEALVQWAGKHGVGDLRTAASWRDATMLRWMSAMGFQLAPNLILDRAVGDDLDQPEDPDAIILPEGQGPGHEIDFGAPEGNDFERIGRDQADVRAMTPADLREIVRIDRGITGRDRTAYINGRLTEAMDNSAIRVSLAAKIDGAIVGFLMARADLGDFGRTEPVAVIDTLGVEPGYARRGVGHALVAQLFANLGALRVERAETVVDATDMQLLSFFYSVGFTPSQRLPFVHHLGKRA
jgi:GNAT superfamily N-acetyltransferase